MTADATQRASETVFRMERPRLIASLARMTGDIDLAEELAQEALVVALAERPSSGVPRVPRVPGAWLTAVAKRRAIDAMRRRRMVDRKHAELARELGEAQVDIGEQIIKYSFEYIQNV